MPASVISLMRMSLWLLLVAAGFITLSWLMLVVASGFSIWNENSNAAGLTIQAGLLLSPVALFLGLKLSKRRVGLNTVLFVLSWSVAFAALIFMGVL